jgi:hypothetical protein
LTRKAIPNSMPARSHPMRRSAVLRMPPGAAGKAARSGSLACVLLLVCSLHLPALSRTDLDRVLDLSVTLKTLSAAADGAAPLPYGRMLLLSGTVSDVAILDKDEATFRVRIELITGEWVGTEDVKAYACYVEFSGPEYFKVFPARPPRKAAPGTVVLDSRVIVMGAAQGVTTTPLGEKRVRVQGAYIRALE